MGLTENQKRLITAVAQNDIQAAKKIAIACVVEDNTQKNKHFCTKYKQILENRNSNLMELPNNLQGIIYMEDVSSSFKESRYYLSERERVLFDNVLLMKKVNEELMKLEIPYINSTLLYGPSGTGKTTFGRYVAYKTGLPFCYLNFSNLIDSYMGNTSKNISRAFDYAITHPCVFMLDEIDCISIKRTDTNNSGGTGGEIARITISLMQEFDKLPNDVIVIGATNRKDRIDEALLRRFSIKHEVKILNRDEKISMIDKYLHALNIDGADIGLSQIDSALLENKVSQAEILNYLIRRISKKIAEEITTNQ